MALKEDAVGLQYISAAFAAWSRSTGEHSNIVFDLISEPVFGEDGPPTTIPED